MTFTNSLAWPHDFIEQCSTTFGSGGLDAATSDLHSLTVYAGHGNKGLLQWGFPHNGRCTISFEPNMRLGSMAGASSGYAMYVTSCTLAEDSLVGHANFQWVNQQFGYHNSPSVGDDQPANFYDLTDALDNTTAWLDETEDRPGWFTGDNSPIVVTHGTNSSNCSSKHNFSFLGAAMSVWTPMPGGPTCGQGIPSFWYCYTLRDNGGC
ncbi:hypothetical protein [Sorangium sp. So ce128]|uniref:hypothetical protein n=1 Tax=Sorangium sp. So ce128 TaxID=3133281 RepID=UPI003F60EEAB